MGLQSCVWSGPKCKDKLTAPVLPIIGTFVLQIVLIILRDLNRTNFYNPLPMCGAPIFCILKQRDLLYMRWPLLATLQVVAILGHHLEFTLYNQTLTYTKPHWHTRGNCNFLLNLVPWYPPTLVSCDFKYKGLAMGNHRNSINTNRAFMDCSTLQRYS